MLLVSDTVDYSTPMEHMLDLAFRCSTSSRDRAITFQFLFSLYDIGLISS